MAIESLNEGYSDGDYLPDPVTVVEALFEDNCIAFDPEDFINKDDHAGLVNAFVSATNGKWRIENCHSHYDAGSDKWVLNFTENGNEKTWRFAQSGDMLNEKFLHQLIAYTESQSGHVVCIVDNEDFVSLVCLLPEIYELLFKDIEQAQVA